MHVLAALEGRAQDRVVEQLPRLDRLVHTHEVLEEDATRADGEVPDFGVAHLARRQPDRLAGGLQRRVRVLRPEAIEDRRVRERDRVSGTGRSASPTVEDDEDYERIRAAVSHIAAKDSSVSPKYWRRSECPTSEPATPRSSSIDADTSPVYAPSRSQWTFCANVVRPAATHSSRRVNGGQTIASTSIPAIRSRSATGSGPRNIFQLPAMITTGSPRLRGAPCLPGARGSRRRPWRPPRSVRRARARSAREPSRHRRRP